MSHEAMDAETVAGLLGDSGISVRQLRNYCDLGCPFEKRGRERVFNWFAVLDWYIAFKASGSIAGAPMEEVSPAQPRDQRSENLRMTTAAADLKELQLAEKRGQVISIVDAKENLDRMLGNLRSRLLSLPGKINSRIGGMREPSAREAAIKDELEVLCRDLSTGSIVELPAEPESAPDDTLDSLEAAAEPQPSFSDEDFGLA